MPAARRADGRYPYTLVVLRSAHFARDRGLAPTTPPSGADICLVVEGTQFPFAPWRSNTLTIPHAAIRVALGGDS